MDTAATSLDAQLYPILSGPATDDCTELLQFLLSKQNTVLDDIKLASAEIAQRIATTEAIATRDDQMRTKIATVLDHLHGIQQKLQTVQSNYTQLLDQLLDYVQRCGETRAQIERFYSGAFRSQRDELADALVAKHEQFREQTMHAFRALIAQSERCIERVRQQEPEGARDHDTDRVLGLLERLRGDFERQAAEKAAELGQQQAGARFAQELREVHRSLDEVEVQLKGAREPAAATLAEAETRRAAFGYFEQTIEVGLIHLRIFFCQLCRNVLI